MLSRKFLCHINVKLSVSRLGGRKYLVKYICKGRVRATNQVQNETRRYNQINNFVEGRYVSASEASMKILEFGYVDIQSVVVRLDVHLDGHHILYYRKRNDRAPADRNRSGIKRTGWFQSNKLHQSARRLLYSEYAMYFARNRSSRKRKPRAAFKVKRRINNDILNDDEEISAQQRQVIQLHLQSPQEYDRQSPA